MTCRFRRICGAIPDYSAVAAMRSVEITDTLQLDALFSFSTTDRGYVHLRIVVIVFTPRLSKCVRTGFNDMKSGMKCPELFSIINRLPPSASLNWPALMSSGFPVMSLKY